MQFFTLGWRWRANIFHQNSPVLISNIFFFFLTMSARNRWFNRNCVHIHKHCLWNTSHIFTRAEETKNTQKKKNNSNSEKKNNKIKRIVILDPTHMRFMRCGKFIGPHSHSLIGCMRCIEPALNKCTIQLIPNVSPFNLLVSISRQSIVLLFFSLFLSHPPFYYVVGNVCNLL